LKLENAGTVKAVTFKNLDLLPMGFVDLGAKIVAELSLS